MKKASKARREALMGVVARAKHHIRGDKEKGTIFDFADAMNCSPQWIYKQVSQGEFHPEFARALEEKTNGEITRAECNPRLFG